MATLAIPRPLRVVSIFGVVAILWYALRVLDQPWRMGNAAGEWLKLWLWVPAVVVATRLGAGSWRDTGSMLGLIRSPLLGVLFGIAASMPALIEFLGEMPWERGVSFVTGRLFQPRMREIVVRTAAGAFAEELLFSGFIVSQLIRHGPARPALAVVICALTFGFAHIGNGGVAAIVKTSAGGLLFAWLFVVWQSLWPGIALHAVLNVWWFVDPTIAMFWHLPTMVLAIVFTLARYRRSAPPGRLT